jgi:hypothetical protein
MDIMDPQKNDNDEFWQKQSSGSMPVLVVDEFVDSMGRLIGLPWVRFRPSCAQPISGSQAHETEERALWVVAFDYVFRKFI